MKTLSQSTQEITYLFAENIYTLYEFSGLSMDDFAAKAETNRSTVYHWVQHKTTPLLELAWKICECYGVNIYDMCTKRLRKDGTFEDL